MSIDNIRKIKEQANDPKPKKKYTIPKKSKKKLKQEAQSSPAGAELNRWFDDRRNEMTGFCSNCGKPSCKNDDQYYKFSIAHILPKAYFGSVKTHPDNWVELCFWGDKSCHTNMDNNMLNFSEMSNWNEIVVKFQRLYPNLTQKERARVPDIFLQYLNTDQ